MVSTTQVIICIAWFTGKACYCQVCQVSECSQVCIVFLWLLLSIDLLLLMWPVWWCDQFIQMYLSVWQFLLRTTKVEMTYLRFTRSSFMEQRKWISDRLLAPFSIQFLLPGLSLLIFFFKFLFWNMLYTAH